MNVLVYLVPIALALGLTGLFAFVWSIRNGQLDDLDGAAVRVLSDDDLTEGERPPLLDKYQGGLPEAGQP